jgi:putative Mg2+ transporter-C (MgtC) family protein
MEFRELVQFGLNVGVALLMGMAIGLERQFRQHPAGLRTNALVCLGAALFVSLTRLMGDHDSPTRIASYIVSGIGFLGGGVILREGANVKGINTAATLWCSAAVGTLAGAGFPAHAVVGTLLVLSIHLGLRPLARWVDARRKLAVDVEVYYRVRVVCPERDQGVNSHPQMTVQGILTQEADQTGQVAVVVDIYSLARNERKMEDLVRRLDIEPGVTAVSWEKRE